MRGFFYKNLSCRIFQLLLSIKFGARICKTVYLVRILALLKNNRTLITDTQDIKDLIKQAFDEDVSTGDVTTNAIVDESADAEAVWISKEKGRVAGLEIARLVYEELDPEISWYPHIEEGGIVDVRSKIATIKGSGRALLTAERIALNIVQRMSGIATMTSKFVEVVQPYDAQILDTRKTVPGLRQLDKYAVKAGGGTNHRMGLYDLAMIKDNHIVAAGSITKAVDKVRTYEPEIRIEVETTTIEQVKEALKAGADIIMLDNMSSDLMSEAVELIDGRAKTEASGNITLKKVREVAESGVDYISVGALTHSVQAFDISQQVQKISH